MVRYLARARTEDVLATGARSGDGQHRGFAAAWTAIFGPVPAELPRIPGIPPFKSTSVSEPDMLDTAWRFACLKARPPTQGKQYAKYPSNPSLLCVLSTNLWTLSIQNAKSQMSSHAEKIASRLSFRASVHSSSTSSTVRASTECFSRYTFFPPDTLQTPTSSPLQLSSQCDRGFSDVLRN